MDELLDELEQSVLYRECADEQEWLEAAASNSVFNFLKDPQEDIYTLADGSVVDRVLGAIAPQCFHRPPAVLE